MAGSESTSDRGFPVVGIGASAGGLEAFIQLLKALPEKSGMAFVLVQHLDPKHESRLSDLLAKATTMPVREPTDGLVLEPDHVYVIAPDTALSLGAHDTLHVESRPAGRGPHLPIDHLFRSLAAHRGGTAIGIVLSGTGTDGTLGLLELKAAGGITFAQDEASAKFPGMPLAAMNAGCVDRVLPPDKIAAELVRVGQHPYLASTADVPQQQAPAPATTATKPSRPCSRCWAPRPASISRPIATPRSSAGSCGGCCCRGERTSRRISSGCAATSPSSTPCTKTC